MKRLDESVKSVYDSLAGVSDDAGRVAARAAEVRMKWKNAVQDVYGPSAPLILDHTNAVYIMAAEESVKGFQKEGSSVQSEGTQLVVYADDSLVRSDLDARQEFLKMKLREQGERIGVMKIIASRFEMKERHPFKREEEDLVFGGESLPESSMDERTFHQLLKEADLIEEEALKEALKKAISADFERYTS